MKPTRSTWGVTLAAAFLACSVGSSAQTFYVDSGLHVATATFSVSGGYEYLTLVSNAGALGDSADLLTGLFFDASTTFTPTGTSFVGASKLVIPNMDHSSTALVDYTGSLVLGQGWAYNSSLNALAPCSQSVQAAGLGVGGSSNSNFGGTPTNIDGQDFGIIGTGGVQTSGGKLVDGFQQDSNGPYVQNGVVFDLGKCTDTPIVSHVYFQYGTALNAIPAVPEGSSLALLGGGLLPLLGLALRRRSRRSV